jgi:acetyl esterase/lipase
MTDYEENWGVIRPAFSHDGTKLYWNEEFSMEKYPDGKGHYWGWADAIYRKGEELGAWRVKYADISFGRDGPTISNIRTINPPEGFTLLEGAGFSSDDKRLVYSYVDLSLTRGGRGVFGDIYTTDLRGNSIKKLTSTPRQHDENPTYSPDGSRIAWCHPAGTGQSGLPGAGEEIYIMNVDGSGKTRLTYFSDPKSSHHDPNARQISELSWSPDGMHLVFGHASRARRRSMEIGASVWILSFTDRVAGKPSPTPDLPPSRRPDTGGPARPPGQPATGPGGSEYRHAKMTQSVHGKGKDQYWIFEPADPTPKSAPVIVFNHGWNAMDPGLYGAWIEHVVRKGHIVVYPRFQMHFTLPRTFTENAINGVKDALERLRSARHVRPELDKMAVVGHSAGGVITANMAVLASSAGLPQPKALMIVEPGGTPNRRGGIPLEDMSKIPRSTLVLVLVGDEDTLVRDRDAITIFDGITQIPADRKDYITLITDRHGEPALVADHLAPNATSETAITQGSGSGRRRGGYRPRLQNKLTGSVDAIDYYGLWKLFDALTDAAFYGKNRKYALGNTREQRFMGDWSDGTPVKELLVTDNPKKSSRKR